MKLKFHKNPLIRRMSVVGYGWDDLLPAFPEMERCEVEQMMVDNTAIYERRILPYCVLGMKPYRSRYCNIHEEGFRKHTSDQAWPPKQENKNIFLFGGSTMAGCGVGDGDTVAFHLQSKLQTSDQRWQVYNFGCPGYTLRHEALRLLDLLDRGFKPDMAVFVDGFNEFAFAYGQQNMNEFLDGMFEKEKLKRTHWTYAAGQILEEVKLLFSGNYQATPSALNLQYGGMTAEEKARIFDEKEIIQLMERMHEPLMDEWQMTYSNKLARKVWAKYVMSLELAKTVCCQSGIRSLFFWQPTPYFRTPEKHRVLDRMNLLAKNCMLAWYGYEGVQRLLDKGEIQPPLSWVNISFLSGSISNKWYVDVNHYSGTYAQDIGKVVAKAIEGTTE